MALPRSVSLPFLVVSAAVVATSYRLLQAVDRYSVNVLFWDQWDFYTPLFSRASLWRIFTWQHGPHREGIGLVIDKFVLDATRWNSRAEVLFMVAVLIAATLAALKLKERLFGSVSYGDIAIPCLLLTFAQMEALVGAPNPSYSAVPELLIALYCLAGTLPRPAVRYSAVLILNFLLIFTGFGFFMGLVTLGVLLFDLRRTLRAEGESVRFPALALLIAAASLASFFYHYHLDPAVPGFQFPDPHPWKYPWFIALMMSYFVGLRAVALASVVGGLLLLTSLVILGRHAGRLWRGRDTSATDRTIVILIGFSLLFAANAAVGRVGQGMPEAAQFSRYMGLMVPAFLGIYFHLLTWKSRFCRTTILTLFVIAIVPATLRIPNGYSPGIVRDGKHAWRDCILKVGMIDYCDQVTGFPIYPNPRRTQLAEKLQFLQRNALNLYSGQP